MIKKAEQSLLNTTLVTVPGVGLLLLLLTHAIQWNLLILLLVALTLVPPVLFMVKEFLKGYWSKKTKAETTINLKSPMFDGEDFKNKILYDKVLETTPAFITLFNAQTNEYLFVNKASEQVLGFTSEEILKGGLELLLGLVHPEDVAELLINNGKAIARANEEYPNYDDNQIIEFEYRMRHKIGTYKWVHTYAIVYQRNTAGIVEKILNISVDVTLRKEAEIKALHAQEALTKLNEELELKIAERTLELEKEKASLRKQAELNELVLKATNDVFWDYNPRTGKVFWSGNLDYFFGHESNLQGGDFSLWSSRIMEEDRANVLNVFEACMLSSKTYFSIEYRFKKHDDTYAYIFDRCYIIRDGSGEAIRVTGCISDISKVKEAELKELALQKIISAQDQQFKHILYNAPFMISIRRGPELVMEFANKAYIDYVGRNDVGKTFEEIAGNFKKYQLYEDMWRVYNTGEAITGKALFVKHDRNPQKETLDLWYDYTFAPLYDVDGNVNGVATFGYDVSDLIKANKELKQSEERFRFLADAIPHKIWTASSDGNVNYYNRRWFEFTNLNFDDLKDEGWAKIIHPDDLLNTRAAWQLALLTGNDLELEHRMLDSDGAYRWHLVRARAQKNESGEVTLWVGTNTDIHDQKLVSQALEVSEHYFRQLADEAPFMIWKADEDGNTNYVNKTWTAFTGLSFEESMGMGWLQTLHPEDAPVEAQRFPVAFGKRVPYNSKFRLKKSDGSYRWVMSQSTPIYNPNFTGYIGSLTDINDEEIEQQERASLMQKMDEFMSIASHELKTPITSVKGYLQIAERLSQNNKEFTTVHSFVTKANRQINKLTSLVEDLLDVTKINAGKMILNRTWFLLGDAVAESIEQVQTSSGMQEIIIEDSCDQTPVYADKNRLEQVLVNLLSNALKYSPVTAKVILTCTAKENTVTITVQDFGSGIPKDKIPFIFDRFFRVRETAQTQSGLGLGLYISAEIVKRHNGEMGVNSEEGKGSTFWFTIPSTLKS